MTTYFLCSFHKVFYIDVYLFKFLVVVKTFQLLLTERLQHHRRCNVSCTEMCCKYSLLSSQSNPDFSIDQIIPKSTLIRTKLSRSGPTLERTSNLEVDQYEKEKREKREENEKRRERRREKKREEKRKENRKENKHELMWTHPKKIEMNWNELESWN